MPTVIEKKVPEKIPQRLSEKKNFLKPRGRVFASPATWRDQVLYFLLPDRFSDAKEDEKKFFDYTKPEQYRAPDKNTWMAKGSEFQGGTLKGIESKLDYLKGLGVTTLWVGPIWRQRPDLQTYHGYGIQNFFDVDSRFGTRQDLRDLIDAAHDRDMYVLLDIIYNHTGDNWFYAVNGGYESEVNYRFHPYSFGAWHSGGGYPTQNINTLDDGVWPRDFQNTGWYTRSGKIIHWDPQSWEDPLHPDCEFRRGDFFSLKDLKLITICF